MTDVQPLAWFLGAIAVLAVGWPRITFFYRIWIGAAVKAHATRTLQTIPQWEETNLDHFSPELRDFLNRTVPAFRDAGFEVLANLKLKHDSAAEGRIASRWVIAMLNSRTGDRASITLVVVGSVRTLALGVNSEFADGFYMVTSNSRAAGLRPVDPEMHLATFPWVNDPATLIEAHRRRVDEVGRTEHARKPMLAAGVIDELNESWQRDIHWLVRTGYYVRTAEGDAVRPTWRGAFLSQWRARPIMKRRLI
jgi:hypothetical protein